MKFTQILFDRPIDEVIVSLSFAHADNGENDRNWGRGFNDRSQMLAMVTTKRLLLSKL